MRYLLIVFSGFLLLHLLLPLFSFPIIPEANFPYKDLLKYNFPFPPYTSFANFDGYQYISIAKIGYSHLQQSYFPLFPGVISFFSGLFSNNYILTGIIINSIFFLLGLIFFFKTAMLLLQNDKHAKWTVVFLLVFPTAFFYLMMYPESLFFFLLSGTFYFLFKRNFLFAALFAFFASLTKIQGVILLIPFFLVLLGDNFAFKKPTLKQIQSFLTNNYLKIFLSLFPIFGLACYSIYLYFTYQDPLYFYHTQSSFGANRETEKLIFLPQVLFRYLKIFITADRTFSYWIALLEFSTISLILSAILVDSINLLKEKKKRIDQLSLHAFSLVTIILPTLTGTLTSIPRYALISFGFFIALSKIKNIYIKIIIALLFFTLHILLFTFFLKGYFIS